MYFQSCPLDCGMVNLKSPKVSRPTLVTYPYWTPIFEWCMVRCGSKNGHQKTHVFKKIGLRA